MAVTKPPLDEPGSGVLSPARSSGSSRCRTGRASSCPWPSWPCWASSCVSVARQFPSRWPPPTPRPAPVEARVGVTQLTGLAPAGQVLAGQLLSGGLDQLGVIDQVAAEQGDGLVTSEGGHRVGIAPARWTGDNDGARGFARPWLAAELHPSRHHGSGRFIGSGARPAAGRRRCGWVAALWSRPRSGPPEAGQGRVRTAACRAGRTGRGAVGG
jgi:hypothetical protein